MRFRCAQCRALTQVQIPAQMTAPLVTACSGCGRRYRFAVDRPRAADDQERYRRAKEFAFSARRFDQQLPVNDPAVAGVPSPVGSAVFLHLHFTSLTR